MQRTILACVDGSHQTASVLNWACWLSDELKLPLTIIHVLDQSSYPKNFDYSGSIGLGSREALLKELAELDAKRNRLALEHGQALLKAAKNDVECSQSVSTIQRHGSLVETLKEFEEQTAILVIGRSGEHSDRVNAHVGGQVASIIREINRPVLVAESLAKKPSNIMIAFDGSKTSRNVLALASKSPLLQNRSTHIVMVGEDRSGQLQHARQLIERSGHKVETSLLEGSIDSSLFSYVKEKDIELMVLGAFGHSRVRQFLLGSNTAKILARAEIPLLFLR